MHPSFDHLDARTGLALAREHAAALQREADHHRLVRLVQCCRPSALLRAGRRAAEALQRLRPVTPACC